MCEEGIARGGGRGVRGGDCKLVPFKVDNLQREAGVQKQTKQVKENITIVFSHVIICIYMHIYYLNHNARKSTFGHIIFVIRSLDYQDSNTSYYMYS